MEVEAEVEAASIVTGTDMRDEWKLAGDLTIRGVTKPVVFDLEYHGSGPGTQPGSVVAAGRQ